MCREFETGLTSANLVAQASQRLVELKLEYLRFRQRAGQAE